MRSLLSQPAGRRQLLERSAPYRQQSDVEKYRAPLEGSERASCTMKHQKGIDLVRSGADAGYSVNEGNRRGASGLGSTKPARRATAYGGDQLTLAEVKKGESLSARCVACCHEARIDHSELARRFGASTMIGMPTPRLRCGSCGNKGNNRWIADGGASHHQAPHVRRWSL